MPGGVSWGLKNKDASPPSGWRNDLLDFKSYGGPGGGYKGPGKLPPKLKDLIIWYFWLLGADPNHGIEIPEGYVEKNFDNLRHVFPPPCDFILPNWATPYEATASNIQIEETEAEENEPETAAETVPSNEVEESAAEPSRSPIVLRIARNRIQKRIRSPSRSLSPIPQPSSTMQSTDTDVDNSPVAHLRQQRFASKPPKKVARQPTRESCAFCGEEQTEMDVKSKNILVRCSEHLSHKYCKNRCREAHAELF